MSGTHDALVEAVEEMRAVFMSTAPFLELVNEGAAGDEEFTMRGDDLAAFCWSFNVILEHFGVEA